MNFRLGTRLWVGLLFLLVLFWATGLLVAQQYPGLPTPPAITAWGLPALRYARDLASMFTLGALVVGAFLIPGSSRRVLNWALGWATIWFLALAALLIFTISDLEAISIFDALNPTTWWQFLASSYVGSVFAFQFLVVGIAWVFLALLQRTPALVTKVASTCCVVIACGAPAFLGHGGFTGEHVSMTISLAIHIAAVSLWVGGLAVVVAVLLMDTKIAAVLLPRFSLMALWCVIVLAETGLLNASLRESSMTAFVSTLYGSFILLKATLLGWLIYFGWIQRTKILPTLEASSQSRAQVIRFAGTEFLLMATAIAISITMSRVGFETPATTVSTITPLAILTLALFIPALIDTALRHRTQPATPRNARIANLLRNYPEVASMLLLVVVVETAGIGLPVSVFGANAGTVISTLLLLVAGWLWFVSINGPRRLTGIILVMVGFPIALILSDALSDASTSWQLMVLSVIAAECVFAALIFTGLKATVVVNEPTPLESSHV